MTSSLECRDEQRRLATADSDYNGIDYLEVASADQRVLEVHFVHPLPGEAGGVPAGPGLTAEQVVVSGGERIANVRVTGIDADGDILRVTVDAPGDFSTYTLRLIRAPGETDPPVNFDPALSSAEFSFKADCPSPFDCAPEPSCPPPVFTEPVLDYLAKDYESLLRLLTDRLALVSPAWRDHNPADPQQILLELLADLGDRLSYEQDAAATEAYLGTARSRVSLRRHARALDYRVHDGCNARTWVRITVAQGSPLDGHTLPAHRPVLTGRPGAGPEVEADAVETEVRGGATVFETMTGVTLMFARNRIPLHTWGDEGCCLPSGATEATLVNDPDAALAPGDLLLLQEERSPGTGLTADADPSRRHVVRLTKVESAIDPVADDLAVANVAWSVADALPFSLQLQTRVDPDEPAIETAGAAGNIVIADHGCWSGDELLLRVPESDRPFRPRLALSDLTVAGPLDDDAPASRWLLQDPTAAFPQLGVHDGSDDWVPARDLLGASATSLAFVTEIEHDGRPALRFGDGINGLVPPTGTRFTVRHRTGNGPGGNIGAGSLSRLVVDRSGLASVDNPLAATGGRALETRDEIVTRAPAAFKRQERAVTEADWLEVTQRHAEVQRAAARLRWTGSWWTVFVTVDRIGGTEVVGDPGFRRDLLAHLERFRVAGYDLELRDPTFVPIELWLRVCAAPDSFAADIEGRLLRALAPGPHPDGATGFFHPDNLSFGQAVYLSAIQEAAMRVSGVTSVDVERFQRFGEASRGELAAGYLEVGDTEVPRLDNDPSLPERGRLRLSVKGGL